MSTRITVTSDTSALVGRIREVQQANREAQLERERDTTLRAHIEAEVADTGADKAVPRGGNPDTSIQRRPAAQRDGGALIPFALSWCGTLTPRTPTVYQFQTRATSGVNPVPPSIITYSGGDYLAPSTFEITSAKSVVQIAQPERYSEWKTTAKIAWLSFYGPEWSYEGFWAEELRSTEYGDALTWQLPSAPSNLSPVGPMGHSTTGNYLAVGTDGTMFITVALPYEAIPTSSVQTPSTSPPITTFYRDVYYSSVNEPFKLGGLQQYVTVNGSNVYNGLPLGSFANYPSKPLYTFAGQPYLFLKIKNGQITTKTATKTSAQSFGDFYAANAWEGDPGLTMRGIYLGEVRVRGTQAHLLRMRYEEIVEGDTYIWYEDFPFPSLTSFITGTGAQARLQAGVTFEDHVYDLSPYANDAELATQLAAIVNPSYYPDQPEYLPDQVVKVKVSSNFIAAAANRLSTSGADVLTPLTYFVAMP